MVGACFVEVGTEDNVRLSELKITGYENSTYYLTEEMGFGVTFQRRASNGMPFATYAYSDSTDDMETWNGGKWYDIDNGGIEVTAENDVTLTAGDGLWFDTPALQDCSAFTLQSSGSIVKGDFGFELNAGGKIGVCNMMPVGTTLSKIEIHGYEDSVYFLTEEMGFGVTMQSLGSNGMPLAIYAYSDSTDDMETWNGGKWYDIDNGGVEVTEENDIEVDAGEGFWVDTPALQDCTMFKMVFPACVQ